jgi:hypothetical protein
MAAAKQEIVAAMATIFATTAKTPWDKIVHETLWDKIVHEQTEKDQWTNLRGEEQSGVRSKMMAAWQDCFVLMLKTVFANNAAEQ